MKEPNKNWKIHFKHNEWIDKRIRFKIKIYFCCFFFVGCEKPFRKLFLPFRVEFIWLVPAAAAASSIADPFYRWEIIIISNHSLFRFNVFSIILFHSRLTSHRISFRQSHANTRTEQRNSCVDVELIEHERLQWLLWVWCVRLFWISFNVCVESKRI